MCEISQMKYALEILVWKFSPNPERFCKKKNHLAAYMKSDLVIKINLSTICVFFLY